MLTFLNLSFPEVVKSTKETWPDENFVDLGILISYKLTETFSSIRPPVQIDSNENTETTISFYIENKKIDQEMSRSNIGSDIAKPRSSIKLSSYEQS